MLLPIAGLAAPADSEIYTSGPDGIGYFESIAPGAFRKMIGQGVRVILQHEHHAEHAMPIADTASGTLTLRDSSAGLLLMAEAPIWAVRAVTSGKTMGLSISLAAVRDEWEQRPSGTWSRRILECEIDHIATCANPAYRETGAWRADCDLDNAPSFIRAMAERWLDAWTEEPEPEPEHHAPALMAGGRPTMEGLMLAVARREEALAFYNSLPPVTVKPRPVMASPRPRAHDGGDVLETMQIPGWENRPRLIEGLASTSRVNDHGYSLAAKGCTARLPIKLKSQHSAGSIGEIVRLEKRENSIYVVAAVSTDPAGDHAWSLIQRGETLGLSGAASGSGLHIQARVDGKTFYDRWTLSEVSVCRGPTGANKDCSLTIYQHKRKAEK